MQIMDTGWTIHRAVSSTAWPGDATLEIAKVWATSQSWNDGRALDGLRVAGIDEMLYPVSQSGWRKQRLKAYADQSFQGSILLGTGFTMSPEEAQALIEQDARNKDVLFPYLAGRTSTSRRHRRLPGGAINFFDWPEEKACGYPDCFAIVSERVKPERATVNDAAARNWWRHLRPRPKLYRTIEPLARVLAIALTSKSVQPCFVPVNQVFANTLGILTYDDDFHFGVLTSGFHYRWAVRYASSLRTDLRYTPSDVFETFPQPPYSDAVASAGGNWTPTVPA